MVMVNHEKIKHTFSFTPVNVKTSIVVFEKKYYCLHYNVKWFANFLKPGTDYQVTCIYRHWFIEFPSYLLCNYFFPELRYNLQQ